MKPIICMAVIVLLSLSAYGATIHVPNDYPTIQKAINASSNRDSVVVADGEYQENIVYHGKQITVMSESANPGLCIIDGGKKGPCVSMSGGISGNICSVKSVIQGFTITNGLDTGGGVYAWGNGFTVKNCYFTGNSGELNYYDQCGVSIYARVYDYWVIEDCVFDGEENDGAATRCSIVNINGMWATYYSDWCIFRNNIVSDCRYNLDPCVAIWSCSVIVEDNLFADNKSYYGTPLFVRIGCAQILNQFGIVRNNVIRDNRADGPDFWIIKARGGGMFIVVDWQSQAWVINNTVYGNYATAQCGGIMCSFCFGGTIWMLNNIVWGNDTHPVYGNGAEIEFQHLNNSVAILGCNVVEGGNYRIRATGQGKTKKIRTFNLDPCFINASNRDFHISVESPCIDMGFTGLWCEPLLDFDGQRRRWGKAVDIGADEFIPSGDM